MIKRLWKFTVERETGSGYLLSNGEIMYDRCSVPNWIGTDNEAEAESERRSNAAEERYGFVITRVIYESQGRVKSSAKTGQEEMPF